MQATEFLSQRRAEPLTGTLVLYGDERYFRGEILRRECGGESSGDEADADGGELSRFAGATAALKDVLAELRTVSMFGGRRIVVVEDADEFVSANRAALERLVVSPPRGALLILDVKSWPKNTKLFKLVDKHGLALECRELSGAALTKWLQSHAQEQHGKTLDREAAMLIPQLAGDGLALLEQEIAKLAALVGDAPEITRDDVTRVVGGWRLETTWEMLDAVRDNHPAKALQALDKLLLAGEAPQKILGGVVYTFRKFADATERARQGGSLREALSAAGVFPQAIDAGEAYLRRIRFAKASRILALLIEADSDLKGGSRVDPRPLLERLFVRLSGETVAAG
jgi:DNA polymerase-3 subunit delta